MNGFDLSTIQDVYVGGVGYSSIYYENNLVWQKSTPPTPVPYDEQYLTIESLEDNNDIGFVLGLDATTPKTISVSTDDGNTWSSYTSSQSSLSTKPYGTVLGTLNTGDKMLIKGNNTTYNNLDGNTTYCNYLYPSKDVKVYGNIMSLVYGDSFQNKTTLTGKYAFWKMFSINNFVDAENLILPATTLSQYCYSRMFVNNTGLTTAPELPATNLANSCYEGMFEECTSLTNGPTILPATTLSSACYQRMFYDCTSLTTAPELPAPILVSYCYKDMFYYCLALIYIKCLATDISASWCLKEWVMGTRNYSGVTFVKLTNTTFPEGADGVMSNWTIQNI